MQIKRKTTTVEGHYHIATFDDVAGVGSTTVGGEPLHRHLVRGGKLLPANGHNHEIIEPVAKKECFKLGSVIYRVG